jgi:predicted metal-dependent hydrolase
VKVIIDELVRSKRRTIGLEITADAKLIIRAPMRVTKKEIDAAITQRAAWILQKQEEARSRREKYPPKQCEEGETFLYLGGPLKLTYVDGAPKVESNGENLIVPSKKRDTAQKVITEWYKTKAFEVFCERAEFYAKRGGVSYDSIKITSALSRWGSCSNGKRLCFTWRLVLAPCEMIDYVIVHELSHIGHPDHSKAFWQRVEQFMPDFEVRRKWFRDNSALLRPDFFAKN